jgi:uncharacterized membrane protein
MGCAVFLILGLLWLGFVSFDLFVHTYGDCIDEDMCMKLKAANGGLVFWRGFAVGLLLCIAYAIYRRFFEDEDV